MKVYFVIILGLLSFNLCQAQTENPGKSTLDDDRSVIILFRHGETMPPPYAETPPNPKLNENGKARAQLLANLLKDVRITKMFSTDLNRTKETAEPMRKLLGLELNFYGVKDMEKMAGEMKAVPGIYAVSGHSNTTPEMVRLLGADPGEPINENEFDRLYVVTIANGKASVVLLRYGTPYEKK